MNFQPLTKLTRKQIMILAGAIITIVIAILVSRPNPTVKSREDKRKDDITAILEAVHKYVADDANSNNFPVGIPSVAECATPTSSGDPPTGAVDVGTKGANLSALLVPHYIEAIPMDPSVGSTEVTGYKICTNTATNAVTVWADATENKPSDTKADLKVTR